MLGFSPLGTTALGSPTANESHSLQVISGTFTLSMQGAAKLITDIYPSGTFTLSGQSVGLSAGRPSNFSAGSFTLTGQNINFDQNFGLIIDSVYNSASFSLTGQNIVFDTGFGMVLDSGAFSLSGQDINFKKDMNIAAERGVFTLTGQDALKGVAEAFDRGQFTYTGQDATLFVGRFLRPVTGEYSYTFKDFKIRGWFSPTVPAEIWTDAA
tara:strand:+ start:91 stop:723 length:633 start_codon:yes stop_codon:yes gene_type:complete